MTLKTIIFYVDVFIALQAYGDALDLAITALMNGYIDDELLDQYYYLRSELNV